MSPIRNGEREFSVLGFFSFRWFSSSEFEICYQKNVSFEKHSFKPSQLLPSYAGGAKRNNHYEEKPLEKLAELKHETVLIAAGETNSVRIHQSPRGENAKKMRTVFPPNKLVNPFSSGRRFSTGWVSPIRNRTNTSFLFWDFSHSDGSIPVSLKSVIRSGAKRNNHFEEKPLEKLVERKPETVLIWLRVGTNSACESHSSISKGRKCEENENRFPSLTSNVSFEKHSFKPSQLLPRYAGGAKRNNHFEEKPLEKLAERQPETVLIWLRVGTNSESHSSISEGRKCEENENRFPSQ
ncbi:hypothetical protein CDAR_120191 [Caerostris darwini]|uniref:Uncharacterized protein n=1 Tax=Caerostris darwini TaxID=1538125 RepID=A0AAV4UPM9_9ARAC|nr:hypothetical protein CDAR_120191 [Caerostris darwini]